MDIKFEGKTLHKGQLAILISIGSFIGAGLVYLIQRGIAGEWILDEASQLANVILLFILGFILSTWYFIRDFVMYDGMHLEMKNGKLIFTNKQGDISEFSFMELRNYRDSRWFYQMFSVIKVTLTLKSSKDFRRYQKVILLEPEKMLEFLKALDANVKKAQSHQTKRIAKNKK